MRVAILSAFPLHVIPSFCDCEVPKGHFATWLPPLAEATAQPDGIERIWITLSAAVSEPTNFTYCNQKFIVLPTSATGRALSLFKKDRLSIHEVLRQIKPDIVHAWGTEDVEAFAAMTSGYPFVLSMQGILTFYLLRSKDAPRTYLMALLEFFILRRTKFLTCESRWAKSILRPLAPRAEITCIEYGVPKEFFDAEWKPGPGRPVALFVGSINTRKGIQDALKAFRSPVLKNAELWVAGSGPLEDRENSPPNIKWLGRLSRAALIPKMTEAWCLVLPTRADTSPNVVKESRVIGLPVVTTACGGQSDYILDGQNGFIVEPNDVERLTDRLHQLLSNFDFCRQRGKTNWESDRAFFHTDIMADKFRDLYKKVYEDTATLQNSRASPSQRFGY